MTDQDYLKTFIAYCPLIGLAIHIKERGGTRFGDIVGTQNATGHIQTSVDGKIYWLHRLIWLYMTGDWPKNQIDHVNGIRHDNRWSNLREVSARENCLNQTCHRNGQLKGVTYNIGHNKWVGRSPRDKITKKQKHLGYFNTMEEAHEAYLNFVNTPPR